MFASLVQITWWDFIWAVNLLNSVHFHRAHYFLRVSSMTSHQQFKSIGEVFLMTFLHGNFLMFDIRVVHFDNSSIKSLNVPKANALWPKWSLRWSRRPWVKLEFSDWSSNLIGSNLIRRSNWLLNYFWKLFLNQLFIFTYSNKIHCSWILFLNVKVKGH